MEPKHTRGPLFIGDQPRPTEGALQYGTNMKYLNVINGRSKIVAKCLGKDEETLIANAKLFAAAPQMLDALLEVVKNIEDSDTECWSNFDFNKIQAAIDKATK
jgi:hypothetical protein